MNSEFALPAVTRLSSRVWRILGQNPGPMTLGGTNTYLVGTGTKRLLIDTGEGVPLYKEKLVEALRQASSESSDREPVEVSKVVLTHWHLDHVGGALDVVDLFPDTTFHMFPSPHADRISSTKDELQQRNPGAIELVKRVHIAPLSAQTIAVEGATLDVIPTPGHTDDHVALLLKEESALFTGDAILGGSSSVFSCYADFMSSLLRMRSLEPALLYPAHGPVITNGLQRIDEQIAHRSKREAQIVAALARHALDKGMTIMDTVKIVYSDTPLNLHAAAAFNVLHHMKKLALEGVVTVCARDSNAAALTCLETMGEYEGGEGSTIDAARVEAIVTGVVWSLTGKA